MSQIIKKFSDFHKVDEGVMDFLGDIISSAGSGVVDVAKGKLIEYLYGYFGVEKESFLGRVLTNLVETIDISEYPQFLSGEVKVKDLAPKLADATIETLSEPGIDGIADKIGVKDKDGWVYRTLKEMISNQTRQNDFRENLVELWSMALGGGSSYSSANKTPFSTAEPKNPLKFTPSEEKKIASDPKIKKAAEESGMSMTNLLNSLTGGQQTVKGFPSA